MHCLKVLLKRLLRTFFWLTALISTTLQFCHNFVCLFLFLPRDAMHSADCTVERCLSVCLTVRLYVRRTPVFCRHRYTCHQTFFIILVLPYQTDKGDNLRDFWKPFYLGASWDATGIVCPLGDKGRKRPLLTTNIVFLFLFRCGRIDDAPARTYDTFGPPPQVNCCTSPNCTWHLDLPVLYCTCTCTWVVLKYWFYALVLILATQVFVLAPQVLIWEEEEEVLIVVLASQVLVVVQLYMYLHLKYLYTCMLRVFNKETVFVLVVTCDQVLIAKRILLDQKTYDVHFLAFWLSFRLIVCS